jgi:hypothetical protein
LKMRISGFIPIYVFGGGTTLSAVPFYQIHRDGSGG